MNRFINRFSSDVDSLPLSFFCTVTEKQNLKNEAMRRRIDWKISYCGHTSKKLDFWHLFHQLGFTIAEERIFEEFSFANLNFASFFAARFSCCYSLRSRRRQGGWARYLRSCYCKNKALILYSSFSSSHLVV